MPEVKNPYRLSVTLDKEAMLVKVDVVERESGNVIETDSFPASEVHANVRNDIALYGLSKKLQDSASESETGPGKLVHMRSVFDQLKAGEWAKERKPGAPVVSAEVEALAELKGISVSDAQTALRKYTKEVREKILGNAQIVERAAQIRTKRASAEAINLEDLA
jgi:hypothetical protein